MKGQGISLESWPWPSKKFGLRWILVLLLCLFIQISEIAEAACVPEGGCEVAYAYYKIQVNETLDSIGGKFQTTSDAILAVNPNLLDKQSIITDKPLYIPFNCECIQDQLVHMFNYQVQRTDSTSFISDTVYEDLTQEKWIGASNALPDINFILTGDTLKIPVKCFCGDPSVSLDHGLFVTYVVAAGTGGNVSGLASDFSTSEVLLRMYNPHVVWNNSHELGQHAFIPVTDKNGSYPPYSFGLNDAEEVTTAGVLAGVATGVGGALVFLSLLYLSLHCFTVEQRNRHQRKQLANKLKNIDDPICKYNGLK